MPGSIDTITVTVTKRGHSMHLGGSDLTYYPQDREFFAVLPGSPEIGTFTFTVASGSLSGTATEIQYINRAIPIPDTSTLSPVNGAILTSKTPVFSWAPVDYNETTLSYRFEINDMSNNRVFATSRQEGMHSCAVPEGRLTPGQTYQWRVRVTDSDNWEAVQNRANSEWLTFTMSASQELHSAHTGHRPGWMGCRGLLHHRMVWF